MDLAAAVQSLANLSEPAPRQSTSAPADDLDQLRAELGIPPTRDYLRRRIANAMAGHPRLREFYAHHPDAYLGDDASSAEIRARHPDYRPEADAVLAAVQPELARLQAQIRDLKSRLARVAADRREEQSRARWLRVQLAHARRKTAALRENRQQLSAGLREMARRVARERRAARDMAQMLAELGVDDEVTE